MPCSMAEYALSAALLLTPPQSPPKRPASLSRDPPREAPKPALMHTLHQEESSVLSVAADDAHIFSGSQGYDIYVWDRRAFGVQTTLKGHTGSVLALEIAKEKKWLFSSSGDCTVRVWCTTTLRPLYVINPYLDVDSGDIFSLSYSARLNTIYFGCQNTSVQWFDFNTLSSPHSPPCTLPSPNADQLTFRESDVRRTRPPTRKKFFADGLSSGQATPTRRRAEDIPQPMCELQVHGANVIDSAHYGYVYSMALLSLSSSDESRNSDEEVRELLVTGSGDETVRAWCCTKSGPKLAHTFEGCAGAVLSLVARNETVYAGCQDGHVKIWDLETKTLVRTIIAQEGIDILSLSMIDTDLYSCSANGIVQRWSASFDCTASWQAHDGIILSSIITKCPSTDTYRLVTGANDNCIKLWEIDRPRVRRGSLAMHCKSETEEEEKRRYMQDTLLFALAKFVSIPSVSNSPHHREDCRQAAIWLKKCLTQLGAESNLLPTSEGMNPLVLATFYGSQTKQRRPRILFYGHYDVIAAPSDGWSSDPYTLTGRNGYFYGRGATDNKGPILAVACAAYELLSQRALECDLVFLVEGEEEAGSTGFSESVKKFKHLIGDIDAILVSNSTWISEDRPCITYGLRGVVHCSVEISNERPDLHSGVDGGAVSEPMLDMVKLLATLSSGPDVLVPGFYDAVRPQTEDEKALFEVLGNITNQTAISLSQRWREPTLSIHSLDVSGPGNPTVIPSRVKAKISLRIVPDQSLEAVSKSLCDYLTESFTKLRSPNRFKIEIDNASDWWLGDLDGPWFKALENAVSEEWGVEPLRIREGGSIPSVPFLEKEFSCRALHLPLGQSSDRAHLPNERISLTNLRRGKSVLERFLRAASKIDVN